MTVSPPSNLPVFLQESPCLIADPSPSFSATIQFALQQMGIRLSQIVIARKFSDAKKLAIEKKPRLIITEHQIENGFGLDLIEIQDSQFEQSQRISFITTQNSTESTIAEAAEGQVDGYMLKPFPMSAFQKRMTEIVNQKINPSEYLLKVNSGKIHFAKSEFDMALGEFLAAKSLKEKPTLACFFAGNSFNAKGDYLSALKEYKQGQSYQALHYLCLTGEFDALVTLKNYEAAYELIEPIRKNYPITSRRLANMFVAAVYTNHFDDLSTFYSLYCGLDIRTPELIQISSIAMLTAGKYFIKQQNFKKALEYFEIGLMINGRSFSFLERIVMEFTKMNAFVEAELMLSKVNPLDIGTDHYTRLHFQVSQLILPPAEMVEKSRKIISAGLGTPEIFKSVVLAMAKLGKETLAESTISKAIESDPKLGPILYKILSDNLPNKT